MANCNKLFNDFKKIITPSSDEMAKMKKSREALQNKISAKLKEKLNVDVSYYTQGSSAKNMKTIIIKEDGTYDADRGVYLPEKPDVTAETVQRYVYEAVKNHTDDGSEHRRKCIRVFFKCCYNIDFPVYYEVKDQEYAYLAVKENGWVKDSPWETIEWLEKYKDENGQLIRIIKYIKAWASKLTIKSPSGIALSVWACENFSEQADRDDESLYQTLKAIKSTIGTSIACYAPVEPFDNYTEKLSQSQKEKFKTALDKFVEDAKKALNEKNQLKASNIWREHLGNRFPQGVDDELEAKEKALLFSASQVLSGAARLDPSGNIGTENGVIHKPHRNYGG